MKRIVGLIGALSSEKNCESTVVWSEVQAVERAADDVPNKLTSICDMQTRCYNSDVQSKPKEASQIFTDRKEGADDEPRSGRPSTSITPDTIERVLQMIVADYHPDSAPADLLFPRLKLAMKDDSQTLRIPNNLCSERFHKKHFLTVSNSCQKCVVASGEYFESQCNKM
ncbi:hypothetical protein C0J52_20278 [Blattella germanica]|nr:hypothetical protein C0J52_20278 [Blattella germanica]